MSYESAVIIREKKNAEMVFYLRARRSVANEIPRRFIDYSMKNKRWRRKEYLRIQKRKRANAYPYGACAI